MGDLSLIPELEKAPGEGRGYPLQYSGLENYMDCIVHGFAKSRTRLSDFHMVHMVPNRSGYQYTEVLLMYIIMLVRLAKGC